MWLALHGASSAFQPPRQEGAVVVEAPPHGSEPLHTVARTIDQLAPQLPLALVGPAASSRLRLAADSLPAALTSWIYLECRLRRDAQQVDLIVRVDQRGRDILSGDNPVIEVDFALQRHPVWRGVRALARGWSDPSSTLHRGVERIWLEFDLHEADITRMTSALPAPGVFIEFTREVYAQHSRENRASVALAALRAFMPDGMAPAMLRYLRRCWELLPSGTAIPYVGVFPARGSSAVRVCIAGLGDADLPGYLRALRWPGSYRDLLRAIAAFLPPVHVPRPRMAIINLDVVQELDTRVGIEYVLSHAAQLRGSILEKEFLDHLVRSGSCTAAKCDALLGWPATSLQSMPHELWRSRASRRVNHLKLAYADGELPEVKAYLSASHEFRPARLPSERASIRLQPSTR